MVLVMSYQSAHSEAPVVDKAAGDHTHRVLSLGPAGGCSVLEEDVERSHCTPEQLTPTTKSSKNKFSPCCSSDSVLPAIKRKPLKKAQLLLQIALLKTPRSPLCGPPVWSLSP